MQLHAGYLIEAIWNSLFNSLKSSKQESCLRTLLRSLSCFEVDSDVFEKNSAVLEDSILKAASNAISRGLPTRPSLYVEELFSSAFGFTRREDDATGGLNYIATPLEEEMVRFLTRSLHIIDHRLCPIDPMMGLQIDMDLDSDLERDFFYNKVPECCGAFFSQLMQLQRLITSIVYHSDFHKQRVDFAIEFPYEVLGLKGIVLEVDGAQHKTPPQSLLDAKRDKILKDNKWETLRFSSDDWLNIDAYLKRLSRILDETYFQILEKNIEKPLTATETSLAALQLALSPFGISRVQKVVLELLLRGALDLSAESWCIAVVERDVPCAVIALEDLSEMLEHLFLLEGKDRNMPDLEIDLLVTEEYLHAKLHDMGGVTPQLLQKDHTSDKHYDIVIDVSLLQRPGLSSRPAGLDSRHYAEIRSAHAELGVRRFHTDGIITYREVAFQGQNEDWNIYLDGARTLRYFLQNWFRKKTFREGQLEILNRALQGKSVIGLLPTGGGKSLTYQIASLLQPGITLVIDPLISLMKDQVDGLKKNWIDACSFVNSTLSTLERKEAIRQFSKAEVLFAFVSPERMQMEEFRSALLNMYDNTVYFSYFVIDETHCVSEWGHDFRYSYLRLGNNARRFCLTKHKQPLPIFGLTATASYDVLSEVQRELSDAQGEFTLAEDAVIRHDTVNRQELHFRILEVDISDKKYPDEWAVKQELGMRKKEVLQHDLELLPVYIEKLNKQAEADGDGCCIPEYCVEQFFDDTHQFAGIVFCPWRSSHFGVTGTFKTPPKFDGVADYLKGEKKLPLEIKEFMGGGNDGEKTMQKCFLDNQEDFINNGFHLMVATKAFGMGIDKPNVRYTYHVNYPQSLESFVQEAGRAGRDRKLSVCNILFNDQEFTVQGRPYNVDIDILEYFHSNSFRGAEKEIWVLEDMFREISFGNLTNAEHVVFDLDLGLESEITAKLWEIKGKCRLYLNFGEDGSLGYIDLNNWTVHPDDKSGQFKLALEILADKLKAEVINAGMAAKDWLKMEINISHEPGLQKHIDEMQVGDARVINIGFKNDHETHKKKLDDILKNDLFSKMKEKDFRNIPFTWDAVLEHINKKHKTKLDKLPDAQRKKFREQLFGIRDKADTEKALYRLSLMGLVEDYTVDFNSNTFRVMLRKRNDEDYVNVVRSYVRLHYSEVRTKEKLEEFFQKQKDKEIIKSCLRFLINFVYDDVARRRKEGINVMREACRIGIGANGSVVFKEFLDLYFNSIYARREYLPTDTKDGELEDLSIVWKYVETVSVGAQVNNLKHLRGACMRLLSLYARRNPVFLLLKAFAQLVLEPTNENLVRDSRGLLLEGFRYYQVTGLLVGTEYLEAVREYQRRIAAFTDDTRVHDLLEMLVNELVADFHLTWVKQFNTRMHGHA